MKTKAKEEARVPVCLIVLLIECGKQTSEAHVNFNLITSGCKLSNHYSGEETQLSKLASAANHR